MTQTLRMSLLGDVSIQLGDDFVTGLPSRAAEALLIYLACNPRPVAREKLAELLWAERSQAQALTNLRTILTPLRRELGHYLVVTRQTLAFDHSREHWLDVAEFEQGHAALDLARLALLDVGRAQQLRTVLDLYKGDFLEGFYLKDGHGFEEWATLERERLRHMTREGFRLLAQQQLEAGEYHHGIETTARWRRLDPYSEEACRTHMWLFTRHGQPHLAVQAFQELQQTLEDDLGVQPGAATMSLFECVQGARFPPPIDLPPAATVFIGREAEIDTLARLLLARENRLLTLAGPGGIGKTRLALEAARSLTLRLPGRFLDGVYFVPLAAVKSAKSLPTHIASALGVELTGATPTRQQLLSYLQPHELLLILDNFEHLIDSEGEAVAFLVDLLRQAPNVKLLLTSRERLNLYEEVIFDVQGLALADEDATEPTQASAVQLFVAAGQRVRRDYAPDAEELRSIGRACRLVEGTPLAIELAASWLRHYDSAEIVRQIEQSLDFLASSYRDLPERQRSLRSVFEYSWQLLSQDEQAALAQLSVFTGGFALEAVDAVLGDRTPLADLADKSLLQRLPGGRFDLHPLLRHYAAEKLPKDVPVVTTEQAVKELSEQGFTNLHPLNTWENVVARRDDDWVRISALPGKHGPPLVDIALPDVNGHMLEWGQGWGEPDFHLYISGDTLIIDDLAEIPQRYPNIDLALLHLGGTKVLGVLVTMDAEQGIQMLRIVQPKGAIPIHYNDYTVFESPLDDFIRLVEKAGLHDKVHYLRHGETFEFKRL